MYNLKYIPVKNVNKFIKKGLPPHYISCCFHAVLFLAFLMGCKTRQEPFPLLEFQGPASISNFSRSLQSAVILSDTLSPVPVLAFEGDLFSHEEFVFQYKRNNPGNHFRVRHEGPLWYVNDKLFYLDLPEDERLLSWFQYMDTLDLSGLQIIGLNKKIPEAYKPYLAKLANNAPGTGINCSGNINQITQIVRDFNPGILISMEFTMDNYPLLEELTNLELLVIGPADSIIDQPLPAMPRLRQLILPEFSSADSITPDFLKNNTQLKNLTISPDIELDMKLLQPVKNLKSLVITDTDSLVNPELINRHKNIELLYINSRRKFDYSLIKLPSLRWIIFPENVTQEEFDHVIGTHPGLEVVEIYENRTIKSYRSLLNLQNLGGLTIMDTVMDISTVQNLKNLRYLSLPSELLSDTLFSQSIRVALPNTRIAANEGFCLGSGWLLLVLPLILVFRTAGWYFAGRGKKAN